MTFCKIGMMNMTMLMDGFAWSWGDVTECGAYLIQGFVVTEAGTLILSYVVTLVLCFLHRGSSALKKHLSKQHAQQAKQEDGSCDECSHHKKKQPPNVVGHLLLDSVVYAVGLAFAYVIMLIIMTFRIDLIIVTVVGQLLGHLFCDNACCCRRSKELFRQRSPSEVLMP